MTNFLINKFVDKNADGAEKRKQYGNLSSIVGIVLNILLSLSKISIGILSSSIAIMGDGINNFSDSGSAIISLISFHIASKPADKDHPFGHARFEYISSSLVAMFILYFSINLFQNSISKILTPDESEISYIAYLVLTISIASKTWLYLFYKKIAKAIDSGLIMANADDSFADILSSTSILISLIISEFVHVNLDGYMGLVVSIIIFKSAFDILKTTFNHLMGAMPDPDIIKNLERYLLSYDGVLGMHDLIIHDYGPGRTFVTVHIEVDAEKSVLESHALIDKIERDLKEDEGILLTIHMDPLEINDPKTNRLFSKIKDLVREINPHYSIHDFRVVDSGDYTNVVFDVLVPAEIKRSDDDIELEIVDTIKRRYPDLVPVITIDRDFIDALE